MNKSYTQTPIVNNEQEAAVVILFSCLLSQNDTDRLVRLEYLSRMLLLSEKFDRYSLKELGAAALPLLKHYDRTTLIEQCAPLISFDFRETLFTMICDLLTLDGKLDKEEGEMAGVAAMYLGLPIETMQGMISIFLVRNKWNRR